MPTFEVTSPDGIKYRVNAPDGATQADAIAYIQNKQAQPKPDAYAELAAKQSTGQNLLAGIGGGMKSLYLGGKQLLGLDAPGEIDSHKQAMAGLNTTTSGKVGDFVGQAALTLPAAFIPGTNTMLGATALGGGIGALQPVSQDESRAANVMLGAAGGAAGKYATDKVVGLLRGRSIQNSSASANATAQPSTASASNTLTATPTATGTGGGYTFGTVGQDASAGLNAPQKALLERLNNSTQIDAMGGIRLTPGQATGSRALQQLEAKLESQPMTSGPFNEIKAHNQRTLNRAAAAAIGENSNTVEDAVLAQAKDRISGVYKMVADKTPRQIDPDQFIGKLSAIENDFEGLLPGSVIDNPLVKRLYGYAAKGQATGEQLQDIASKLGKAATNQMTSANGDRQLGMALYNAKDMADELLASGLNGDTARLFDGARNQYRNLMLLTQRQGVVNPVTGDVSGRALAGVLGQKDKAGFVFGQNDSPMYDMARFARGFQPIVGDSGTATRSPLPNPVNFALSIPMNLVSKAYTSSPAINLATSMSNVANNGLAPEVGGLLAPYLPQAGATVGGLLGARLSN